MVDVTHHHPGAGGAVLRARRRVHARARAAVAELDARFRSRQTGDRDRRGLLLRAGAERHPMARDERAVRGGRLEVAPDAEALARLAAHHFRAAAAGAVRRGGRFAVALAGGSTPRAPYAE